MNVTVITVSVSVAAGLSGIILGWMARAREVRKDTKAEAADNTMLRADVEYIKRGVDDIRIEQRSLGQRFDALAERVTRVEESTKQAHKRIDERERKV